MQHTVSVQNPIKNPENFLLIFNVHVFVWFLLWMILQRPLFPTIYSATSPQLNTSKGTQHNTAQKEEKIGPRSKYHHGLNACPVHRIKLILRYGMNLDNRSVQNRVFGSMFVISNKKSYDLESDCKEIRREKSFYRFVLWSRLHEQDFGSGML